jgi:K+-transporting ATPase ATPase C chain
MLAQARAALVAFVCLTLLTGVAYPLVITVIARTAFYEHAEGSLLRTNGEVVGSSLLGQPFDGPQYFWGRLSATTPFAYNAGSSSASNLGPSSPALIEAAAVRLKALADADANFANASAVPVDLVTASGSGLDPDVSIAAAMYQVSRVARARGLSEARVHGLVDAATIAPIFGVIGEARVNVLRLNLALDQSR